MVIQSYSIKIFKLNQSYWSNFYNWIYKLEENKTVEFF